MVLSMSTTRIAPAFSPAWARDWVRNAFVTWSCVETLYFDMRGSGQLPTHYHEFNAHFSLGHEATFIKASGGNPNNVAPQGECPQSVKVIGGRCDGGVIPIFVCTNAPKPEAAASAVVVDGFEAYGFSRDVWFEAASDIRISNCQIVGADLPDSTHR